MKKSIEVILEVYKDFCDKRNMYKIEIDNCMADIDILEKSIEYSTRIEDTSKVFSPRNSENVIDSIEELKIKKETKERLLEEIKEKYDYYNKYYEKLKPIIDEEKEPDINDLIYGNEKSNEESDPKVYESGNENTTEEVIYNLNLNYNLDDTKEKLSGISHKLDTCLKIFDNDTDRAKQEIKSIRKIILEMLKAYD